MVLRFEEAGRIRFGHTGALPPRRVSSTVTAPRLRPPFYTLLGGCPPFPRPSRSLLPKELTYPPWDQSFRTPFRDFLPGTPS